MAYQHFYSCVPARVSMFRKTDGFDTFAHSSGIGNDFILGELSVVYADKMRAHEAVRIRRGEIPTVYTQAMLRPGMTVQSALTYIPIDYTGERSAYMVHSLLLNEQERSMVFANREALPFNCGMFLRSIAPFKITARESAPISNLQEAEYQPLALTDPISVISKYHPETVKYLIVSVLSSMLGSGKEVCFRLPVSDAEASDEALRLINALMCILPYQMRELLSFVSFVSDADQYPGFRLKCISRNAERPSSQRFVCVDFEKNQVSGFNDNIEYHRPLVTFLYSLFENKQVRDEFHMYVSGILATYTDKPLNIATLGEMVFLFWQASGFYTEETALPTDDAVYQALIIYERYRCALPDEYKARIYKCLDRYYREHRAIPQPIFDCVAALYPGDNTAARAASLEIMLKLIHTDLMREKLFGLIAANYATEDDGVKNDIITGLCSVFYGGFLQHNILSFLDAVVDGESDENKSVILDKLLLSIRTPSVQRGIIAFLDKHYDSFSSTQRARIYATYLEMLPECDQLSALMIALVNKKIVKESDKLRDLISLRICRCLDSSYETKNYNLLPLLIEHSGYCDEMTVRFILKERMGSEMYFHYIGLLGAMSAIERAMRIIKIFKAIPDLSKESGERFLSDFRSVECRLGMTGLNELLRADKYADWLPQSLAGSFREIIIYPQIVHTFYDAFKVKNGKNGVDAVVKYASNNKAISNSDQYRVILNFTRMIQFAVDEDVSGAFNLAVYLPESAELRRNVSEYIDLFIITREKQSVKAIFILDLISCYLREGVIHFDRLYFKYKQRFNENLIEVYGERATAEKIACESATDAATIMLDCAEELCYMFDDYTDILCGEGSGLDRAVEDFIESYGLGVGGFLKKYLKGGSYAISELISDAIKDRNSRIDGVRGLMSLVNQSMRR